MIDRLLGGQGDSYEASRELTDIELNLLDSILRIIMQRLKESWATVTEIYPSIEAKESSPNVVQIVSQNEIVIMVVMEIIIGKFKRNGKYLLSCSTFRKYIKPFSKP